MVYISTMEKGRNVVYDRAKGIGIVLLILGHLVSSNSPVFTIIFSFHMPLFLFVSGLLFRPKYERKEVINKDVLRQFVPFVFFSILGLIITLILSRTINTPPILYLLMM